MELPTPQKLRTCRRELDLTQAEVADQAGVSQPLIARIEGGDVDPRLSTLRSIVDALDAAEGDVTRATELMHEQIVSIAPDDSVRQAVAQMDVEAYSQLPVLREGIPVGSISQSDIIHAEDDANTLSVGDIMSESFPSVEPDATIDEIRNLLDHYKAVIVTANGEAVGIITEADLATTLS